MNPNYAAVAARAAHRCEYCRAPEAIFNFPFEVEHVHPQAKGGVDILSNLALGCRSCNLFKGSKTSGREQVTGEEIALFHPRRDQWSDHFKLDDDGQILGLSATGSATIVQLRMNSALQVRARLQWRRLGLI